MTGTPIRARQKLWSSLNRDWDLLIIGGGITGAGILREAVRNGLKVLLVEQQDFSWGTSSRSSKLVHGGLRYLKEGKVGLTMASVQQREHLLDEAPGLIDPLGFLLTVYDGDSPGRWTFELGLTVYDLLALQWEHRYYSPNDFRMLAPHISQRGLQGGFRYGDAQTDDSRLTLRVIQEAVSEGGVVLNYARVEQACCDENGQLNGVILRDVLNDRLQEISARVVISATGAWADQLRTQVGAQPRIRPLRGSHLIFPAWRLPVAQAVSFLHPIDQRPVFIFPWEGVTLVGTTDVDHGDSLDREPAISPQEVAYLMMAVEAQFPSLKIELKDVVSSFAGVRPVIGTGQADPSKEARDHVIWDENGLLTVTGGKLTTFHLIARDALKAASRRLPELKLSDAKDAVLAPVSENLLPEQEALDAQTRRRLLGRYGANASALVAAAREGELSLIPGTPILWAELRWCARSEWVVHLDDLLLRRVRLGLFLADGGESLLPAIRSICQPELGWSDRRWRQEADRYLSLWHRCYNLPNVAEIPDWRAWLSLARTERHERRMIAQHRLKQTMKWLALIVGALGSLGILYLVNRRLKLSQ